MSNEVNESIEVVSEPVSDVDAAASASTATASSSNSDNSQAIRAIRETSSMASNSSVMTVNEENECYKLESELRTTQARLAKVSDENAVLRRQLDERPPPAARRQLSDNDFVDVNSLTLAEKIEHHLGESDALLVDEDQFKPAMEYLIKNLWSIIAHEYDERSLQSTRLIRDSLLVKIDRVNELIGCARTAQVLEAELDTLKKDTSSLREKVIKQNQLIKSLVSSMPKSMQPAAAAAGISMSSSIQSELLSSSIQILSSQQSTPQPTKSSSSSSSTTTTTTAHQTNTNNNNNKDEAEDENNPTPSVSPSQSFTNHLNLLLSHKRVPEVRSVSQTMSSDQNDDDDDDTSETLQHEQPKPGFLLHGINDGEYIGVTRENEPIPLEPVRPARGGGGAGAGVQADSTRLFLSGQSPSSTVYYCPTCKTTIDPKKIAWEMFMRHVRECDVTRHNVCIFCLRQFPKADIDEFEEHVQSHMENDF